MRVLLVGDDLTTARDVILTLNRDGTIVDYVKTCQEGMALTKRYAYDIVVLSLMAIDMQFDLVSRIRVADGKTPMLILSGSSYPVAKMKGFRFGADDYIPNPFSKSELLTRVRSIVRRSNGCRQPILHVGPLSLNLDSRKVIVGEQPVHVTAKEYAILEFLVICKGSVLSKGALISRLYGGLNKPEQKIIDVFICKIRRKLADAGARNLIITARGRGYIVRDPAKNETDVEGTAPASKSVGELFEACA